VPDVPVPVQGARTVAVDRGSGLPAACRPAGPEGQEGHGLEDALQVGQRMVTHVRGAVQHRWHGGSRALL
jgi:hypothetical protein